MRQTQTCVDRVGVDAHRLPFAGGRVDTHLDEQLSLGPTVAFNGDKLLPVRPMKLIKGRDLSKLVELAQLVSRACSVPIPYNYPVLGEDAFRTATGVHAAAIIKAERKGDAFLADRIYSSVPAALFGRQQEIEIGPMSGESNVMYWLRKNGLPPEPALVKQIMGLAKSTNRLLGKAEILDLARTV